MSLKDKLLENKRLNEQNQFKVAEQQSRLTYELGYSSIENIKPDYGAMYDPFVKIYSDLQLKLQNNTSQNPAFDRKYCDDILNSVNTIKVALENIVSNVEIWEQSVQLAGLMNGIDLMGTTNTRYKTMNVLSGNLKGGLQVEAVDNDINKMAFNIYDDEGFIEKIFLNKFNKLSETQELFILIPSTTEQNNEFKLLNPEIFEQETVQDQPVLTGGVTETYRKKDKQGQVELKSEDIGNNMVQDFYTVDKDIIRNNIIFNNEMEKIATGILSEYEGFDQAIAFNNNILAQATDHYLRTGKALNKNQQDKFIEDYKTWFLETEIGSKFPLGEPKPKNTIQPQEEIVEEQVQEEVVLS